MEALDGIRNRCGAFVGCDRICTAIGLDRDRAFLTTLLTWRSRLSST